MKKSLIALMVILNVGCSNAPIEKDRGPVTSPPINVLAVADAIPKYEKRTRAGNPDQYEVFGKQYKVLKKSEGYRKIGVASWYGTKFHGKKTSNGEVYNMYAMTAAHKTLPIPSYVRVTHLSNNNSVIVRINDRGPFHNNRVIDLSYTAAAKLGIQQKGTGFVEVVALGFDSEERVEQKITKRVAPKILKSPVFYLQVGAFSNSENASYLQNKLTRAKVTSTRIKYTQVQNNEVYKVQVGPLYSEEQAMREHEKLVQIGYNNAMLVVEK